MRNRRSEAPDAQQESENPLGVTPIFPGFRKHRLSCPVSRRCCPAGALPLLAAAAVFFSLLAYSAADAAFDSSNIVPESFMSATGTMSEAQIQSFLQQQGSYLAGYTETLHTLVGPNDDTDPYGWSAAHMIWEAANWYGINPQVILATLQKEQGLITNPSPPGWALAYAMGYGCPDGGTCSYAGFSHQVDWGTWQLNHNMKYADLHSSSVAPYTTGNTVSIDGINVYLSTGATASLYRYTPHFQGNQNFYNICVRWFGLGSSPSPPPPPPSPPPSPALQVGAVSPANGSTIDNSRPYIYAAITGATVQAGSTVIKLDGADVSADATRTGTYVSYRPPAPLAAGAHSISLAVTNGSASGSANWSFTVSTASANPKDYYWSWYDGVGSSDWVLAANPASASGALSFDVAVAGRTMNAVPFSIGGSSAGQVPPGHTLVTSYAGAIGGPVTAMSLSGSTAAVSQRILWNGSSLEEVPATSSTWLSDHYYWPRYDNVTAGFADWVIVANPNSSPVYYEIRIAGRVVNSGTLQAGATFAPTLPGAQGGPLEVQGWTGASKQTSAPLVTSQRVLTGNGAAFNEVPGTPAAGLSDHYLWTLYDNKSPGATDWVLVGNQNSFSVYYELRVAGQLMSSGTIAPGATITPTFPGLIGGPVDLQTWIGPAKQAPADVIASQRVLWGPSFEETPGIPDANLSSSYIWTWYDSKTPGSDNWVLVANPDATPVYYEIDVAGQLVSSGTLQPGASVTPVFAGLQGGPLEVHAWNGQAKQAPMPVLATQRVLWQGHLNEVAGTPANG
jgi:hypothetical protein